MATYDFHGVVRTPFPLCLRPYQSFKQFEFTFYLFIFCWAWSIHKTSANFISWRQGQRQHDPFYDQRDRAHQFRPRVVLKFGVARDDGLDARKCTLHIKQWPRRYEQVNQGSCADPEIFVRQGGVGGGRGPTAWKQSGQCFFGHQFYSLQSGSNGFITERRRGSNFFQGVGMPKETHITCGFPGGGVSPDPLTTLGSPDATACLQNHGLSKFK